MPLQKSSGWQRKQKQNVQPWLCTSLFESGCIVSHRKTFVNVENTTRNALFFRGFLYAIYKGFYSLSKTALQAAKTGRKTGTQVLLP